ncbi:hypothetical protein LJC56_00095 [Christensenellaceae bacterium OttesenSCG-928-K19]|nr:hypothetical protein [Christensenellaceae bacterium OttesenSCG-928-K19]
MPVASGQRLTRAAWYWKSQSLFSTVAYHLDTPQYSITLTTVDESFG